MSALKDLLQQLEQQPRDVKLLQKIGEMYQRRNDDENAAVYFARVAEEYSRDGFFLKAVALFKQALKLSPELIELHVRLADLHLRLSLLPEARAWLGSAVEAFLKRGRTEEAAMLRARLASVGEADGPPGMPPKANA